MSWGASSGSRSREHGFNKSMVVFPIAIPGSWPSLSRDSRSTNAMGQPVLSKLSLVFGNRIKSVEPATSKQTTRFFVIPSNSCVDPGSFKYTLQFHQRLWIRVENKHSA